MARGKWPTKPLDLSALHLLNADIALKAPIVTYGRYLAEQTDIVGKITNGVLDLERFSGRIFGGALSGRAQAAADSNSFASSVRASGLNIKDALKAVTGEAAANGKMDVAFDINSSGRNVANMISALDGRANFSITGMDVDKAVQGSLLSGFLSLFTSLNQLGGKAANDKASVSASFDIVRGIATTRDLKLASTSGNGGAAGSINLPNWAIDIKGQVKLAESMLMKVLKAKIRETGTAVPFAITGSLDAPRVKIDTGAALGAGVPIPGADALLNKVPKGVGSILKGILGGDARQQQRPKRHPPPPPRGSTQEQQQPPSPQQLIQKLFKKL